MLSEHWCRTSAAEVRAAPVGAVDKSEKGRWRAKWKGVRHWTLYETVRKACAARGWSPGRPLFDMADGNKDLVFALPLPGAPMSSQLVPAVGVAATNGGHRTLRVYAGAYADGIGVCVDAARGPAYTVDLNLEREVNRLLDGLAARLPPLLKKTRDTLAAAPAAEVMVRDVMFWAARSKVVPWSKLARLDQLTKDRKGDSMWDVLLAFGRVVGLAAAQDQLPNLLKVRDFLYAVCTAGRGEPVPA